MDIEPYYPSKFSTKRGKVSYRYFAGCYATKIRYGNEVVCVVGRGGRVRWG